MIDSQQGILLRHILSAQAKRNLNNTALINKANCLPYCKRNILLTLLLFWDRVFVDVFDILLNPRESKRTWNVNPQCLTYLIDNDLCNTKFATFFYNFHEPLTKAFIRKLKKELSNGMDYNKKFNYLVSELTELLNLAYIELKGLRINCSTLGDEPKCPSYLETGISECGQADNIFFITMSDEYRMEPGLFEEILSVAINFLKNRVDDIIIVVDYKNMEQSNYVFGPKAKERYENCLTVVKAVYFYNWQHGLHFSDVFEGLEKFLIPDKAGLQLLMDTWGATRELVYFDSPKSKLINYVNSTDIKEYENTDIQESV